MQEGDQQKVINADQRKQQLLLYLESDGFLAEFKDLTGKAAPSDADKQALIAFLKTL